MYALSADFLSFIHAAKFAAPVVMTTLVMRPSERERLGKQARDTARRFGISADAWERWRAGFGARRDLLMVADPEREAARIMENGTAGKSRPKK